jgi:hypothetical protein
MSLNAIKLFSWGEVVKLLCMMPETCLHVCVRRLHAWLYKLLLTNIFLF